MLQFIETMLIRQGKFLHRVATFLPNEAPMLCEQGQMLQFIGTMLVRQGKFLHRVATSLPNVAPMLSEQELLLGFVINSTELPMIILF